MKYYEITIIETGSPTPRQTKTRFNSEIIKCGSPDDIKAALIKRYGRLPSARRKVYCDLKSGGSQVVGFIHSFWNRDISHNSKAWHQTDWIDIVTVEKTPVLLSQIKGGQ